MIYDSASLNQTMEGNDTHLLMNWWITKVQLETRITHKTKGVLHSILIFVNWKATLNFVLHSLNESIWQED